MSVKQTIQIESSTVTSQPIKIPFEFKDISSVPEGKKCGESIVITPLTVRTWFQLKPLLILIEKEDLDSLVADENNIVSEETIKLIDKYDELLFKIVCIGIHNKKGNMPKWFQDTLKNNCTWEDIYIILNAILFRLNFNPFFSSITLCKNVSPLSEEEIIALQENQKTWIPKVASCFSQSAMKH